MQIKCPPTLRVVYAKLTDPHDLAKITLKTPLLVRTIAVVNILIMEICRVITKFD